MATPVQFATEATVSALRTLLFRRYLRFISEWFLLALLGASVWYAGGFGGLGDVDKYPPEFRRTIILHSWERFGVLAAVGSILLLIIYYGTSYEVTPFRIFLQFLSKLYVFLSAKLSNQPESAICLPAGVAERADSEELLDKIADTEVWGGSGIRDSRGGSSC